MIAITAREFSDARMMNSGLGFNARMTNSSSRTRLPGTLAATSFSTESTALPVLQTRFETADAHGFTRMEDEG